MQEKKKKSFIVHYSAKSRYNKINGTDEPFTAHITAMLSQWHIAQCSSLKRHLQVHLHILGVKVPRESQLYMAHTGLST